MRDAIVLSRYRIAAASVGLVALVGAGALLLLRNPFSGTSPGNSSGQAAEVPDHALPWTTAQVGDLVVAIRQAEAEGLRPADYQLEPLQRAVELGQTGPAVNAMAQSAAAALAHDFAAGRVRNRHRFNWYIDHAGPDSDRLDALIASARKTGDLQAKLAGLLPSNPQYAALRDALAASPAGERRDRIAANLERWRWLPRDFGKGDQLYVNLPTYRLEVIRGGQAVASYKAVIGATNMPTPVLSSAVRQVIVNPDWIVPASIVKRSNLRPGRSSKYTFSKRPDGSLRVRQKPGPGNALGKVKIEFPNALAIYFHDTPSRSLFGATDRAFSHGCVRVQNIEALAASLVGDQARFAKALAGSNTRSLTSAQPIQANIVYLTLVPDPKGGLADVGDPYAMDMRLAAALAGRTAKPMATQALASAKPARNPKPRLAHAIPARAPVAETREAATPPRLPVAAMPPTVPAPAAAQSVAPAAR